MKKYIFVVLFSFSVCGICICNTNITSANDGTKVTVNKANIKVRVLSTNKKQIKIKISNNGDKDFWCSGSFILKKCVNNKWRKVKFSNKALFQKTITVKSKKSVIVKLKWRKFFDRNLLKGKYKIKFVRTKIFKIK